MTYGFGLGAGLRALNAAQLGMRTAGNNVANANTPGYSRQRIELGSATPFGAGGSLQIGTGVDVRGISRLVDEGIQRRLQFQLGLVGAAELDDRRYREIESIFGEPDQGLSTSYTDFFGSLEQLRTDPSDNALRGGMIQAGSSIAQQFRLVSQRLGDLEESSFNEVRGLVRVVNQRTSAVAELNSQIMSAEANGSTANDLRDTRQQHITELSRLLDARAIERPSGSVDLLVGGNLVVSGNRTTDLLVGKTTSGDTQVMVGGNKAPAQIGGGRIAALLDKERGGIPAYMTRVDELARNTILEWNRLHSTGMPATGPFHSLTAAYGAVDGDGDGEVGDELLSQSGFEFPVKSGALYVAITDEATGQMQRTKIDINPDAMTLNDLAAELSQIDHLSASVDATGRLKVNSETGYGFDFSPRLDPNPDNGTFGGLNATIGSSNSGPYDLTGQTFPVSFDVTSGTGSSPITTTVTLEASDFRQSNAATAEELATAINSDLGANGSASAVGGRIVIQGNQGGGQSQLTLVNNGGGTVLGDLNMSTATANGRDNAISVTVEGTYSGNENNQFTFVPEGDGRIGQTNGLNMRVLDKDGNLVTTVNVGSGYESGKPIAIGNGISIAFGSGDISATNGQVFALDAITDSDTSDVLVATGMNSFFLGSSASDIAINEDLLANPERLAAGIGNASGDAGNLARMISLRDRDLASLSSNTIEDSYADLIGDIGFETAAARDTLSAQDQLLAQLEADRESVSGVNIDEEMVDMLKYQQSYEAAARFIKVAQDMSNVLINLGR
jgi:flagellar hook-associated protein FlgK